MLAERWWSAQLDSQAITYDGVGTLQINPTGDLTGAIDGLVQGAIIDFANNTTITSTSISGSTLTVDESSGGPLTFQVAGALTGNYFAIQSDGQDGIELVLSPVISSLPTLTTPAALTVDEGGAVALNISATAAETDQNAPTVTISGLADATLTNTAGDTLTITSGSITLTQAQLAGLTLHAGAETTGPYTLSVTATDTEADTAATTPTPQIITVTVNEQADVPTLTTPAALTVDEGGAVALNISATAAETDQNAPTVTISGLADATLTNTAGDTLTITSGSITLTQAQLAGLTLHAGAETTGPYTLSVTATDTEADTAATTPTPQIITVTVNEQADVPTLTTPAALTVDEGGAVALNISATAAETDQNAPTVTISGLADATLTNTAGDTLTITSGSITLTQAQLAGLTLHAGAETTGPYTLSVTATDTEADTAATTPTPQIITVTVNEQADVPTLTTPAALTVDEGGAVALNISATAAETDQNAPTVTISGLADATLTNTAGDTLTITSGSITLTQAQLAGLTLHAGAETTGHLHAQRHRHRHRGRYRGDNADAADHHRHRQRAGRRPDADNAGGAHRR